VTWIAYASTSNVLDASAFQIASGIQGPLAGLATSAVIPFSGVWPLHYGSYYLIVSVSAPEDSNSGNNSGATATATTIGVFNEVPTEPNDDYTNLTNYFDLGVTLKPGMTLLVTGTLNASAVPPDIDDVLRFKTGTAASISLYMSWTGNHVVELFFLKGPEHDKRLLRMDRGHSWSTTLYRRGKLYPERCRELSADHHGKLRGKPLMDRIVMIIRVSPGGAARFRVAIDVPYHGSQDTRLQGPTGGSLRA
jgi:hypothetical protein